MTFFVSPRSCFAGSRTPPGLVPIRDEPFARPHSLRPSGMSRTTLFSLSWVCSAQQARGRPLGAEFPLSRRRAATVFRLRCVGLTPMLEIQNPHHFDEVVAFAKKTNLYEGDTQATLRSRLDYLAGYGGKKTDGTDKTRVRLFKDSAPYSFGFVIEAQDANGEWTLWFHGGLLYHGPHDGHGSGSAPTFAVSLTPTTGWSIHT